MKRDTFELVGKKAWFLPIGFNDGAAISESWQP